MTLPTLLCLVILLGMAAEAAVLVALRRRTGRGPRAIGPMLVAGAALVLALAAALQSMPAPVLYACLAVSLLAHGLDLRSRWRD